MISQSDNLDNEVDEVGFRMLSLSLTNNVLAESLTSFSCSGNTLNDEGVKALTLIIHNNSQIQRLWLGSMIRTRIKI